MNHNKLLPHTSPEYSQQPAAAIQQAADATNVQAANDVEVFRQIKRTELPQQTESAEIAQLLEILQHKLGETASGLNGHLKPRLVSCSRGQMCSAIAYRVQEWQLNPYREAHGGILAAMFDTAMGITAHWLSGGAAVTTVDLLTNYIAPVPADSEIIVYSHVQKAGRTLIRVCAEACICPPGTDAADREHQKLAASASANFMVLG